MRRIFWTWRAVAAGTVGLLIVIGVLGGLVASARGAASDDALEADRQAVRAAHERLMKAYSTMKVEHVTRLLDDSEDLRLFHPRGTLDFESISVVEWGLEQMWSRVGAAEWLDESANQVVVNGDVAWHTYAMRVQWKKGADIKARGTEIWIRRDDGWRLTHAHWSENDEPAGPGAN